MKRAQRLIFMFLALVLTATGAAQAQEEERERDRHEAERQLEEAQGQLAEALAQLRGAQSEDARRSLELAMDALRDAQWRLRTDGSRYLAERLRARAGRVEIFRDPEGFGQVLFAGGRPKIGVIVQTEESSETESIGAELSAVSPGGPAEQAGLEAGDVITRANGESLTGGRRDREGSGHRFVEIVRSLDVGDTLHVEYRRGDENRTATIVTEDMGSGVFAYSFSSDSLPMRLRGRLAPRIAIRPQPDIHIELPDVGRLPWRLPTRWLDMELVTLDEELGEYFGTREGLLVVRAPRDESLNLKSGDVILSIDGRKPKSPSQALRIMWTYDVGESMNIEIMRNKRKTTVTAAVPERDRGFFWEPRH